MIRKAAGCVIIRDELILLLHRIDKDWREVPGGKAEEGETLEQAAKREAKEELGIDVRIIRKLGRTKFNNFQFDLDYTWFLAEIKDGHQAKIGEPANYDDLKYIPIADLRKHILSPSAGNLAAEIEKGDIILT